MSALTLLVFWTIFAFGLAYAAGNAKISLRPRTWMATRHSRVFLFLVELVECPACFGFWTGMAGGLVFPQIVPIAIPWWAAPPALGFFTCGTGYLLGRATGWLREE